MKYLTILLAIVSITRLALAQEVDTLASVSADYTAKRTAGLKRLSDTAKGELEAVKRAQMAIGNLEGANATQKAIESLPAHAANPAATPDPEAAGLPKDAGALLTSHSVSICQGVIGLNRLFIPRFESLKAQLLKTGDLAGANASDTKVTQLNEEVALLTPLVTPQVSRPGKAATTITVEGLVDGNTELRISREGIYWAVVGGEAKVGCINGGNEPTYVNGTRWKPKWRTSGDRGPDISELHPLPTSWPNLTVELVGVSDKRFGKQIKRTSIVTSSKEDHLAVSFKDPESGGAWYKIRLKSGPSQ
jgi:hypothetical protein